MIQIQIAVDDAGKLTWRANSADLPLLHWYLAIAQEAILAKRLEPQPLIAPPGPMRVDRVS